MQYCLDALVCTFTRSVLFCYQRSRGFICVSDWLGHCSFSQAYSSCYNLFSWRPNSAYLCLLEIFHRLQWAYVRPNYVQSNGFYCRTIVIPYDFWLPAELHILKMWLQSFLLLKIIEVYIHHCIRRFPKEVCSGYSAWFTTAATGSLKGAVMVTYHKLVSPWRLSKLHFL